MFETTNQKLAHLPALDGVRALSIILVLLAHTAPLGPKFLNLNSTAGLMGMSLFFCMSGYLITAILSHDQRIGPFLLKRLARIVPGMWLYLLILVVFLDVPLKNALLNAAFVSNYFVDGLSIGPISHLWSLNVEIHFYLGIALAVLVLGRRGLWLIPVAALIVTGLRIESGIYYSINTHWRVDEILSGGCLALLALRYGEPLRRWLAPPRRAIWLLTGTAVLWVFSSSYAGGPLNYLRPYLAATLVGIVLHSDIAVLKWLMECAPARYIARTSYALYIYHPLMVYGVMNTGSDWLRYLVKRPISYVLTLAAAHLSTFYWEQRWQKAARNVIASRSARPEASDGAARIS